MVQHSTKPYSYIFGPVPSRRLGLSLGVDLVLPKTCSLDCVYCESGRTTDLTAKRSYFVPPDKVIDELARYLASTPELDHITFSGCGEPVLNLGINEIATFLKDQHPSYKLALLTNGTLFHRPDVRKDVQDIDVIIASLDAVSPSVFKHLNRPVSGIDPEMMIRGLKDLRQEFFHALWLEIFIVPGLNDTDEELKRLSDAVRAIGADRIQLNSLDRPGTERWVRPLTPGERERIAGFFEGVDVVGGPATPKIDPGHGGEEELNSHILGLVRRRPSTLEDIHKSTGIDKNSLLASISQLEKTGIVVQEKMERGVFYRIR